MESEFKRAFTGEKLPMLVSLIAMAVSGIVWATTASVKADTTSSRIDKLEASSQKSVDEERQFEREVIERLARIEQALQQ